MASAPILVNAALRQRLHDEARAIYLPAISHSSYARPVYRGQLATNRGITAADLNFLDPRNRHFHYPYALYSAGQQSSVSVPPIADIVSTRSRADTIVLGDSGGYQVSTTPGYFKPDTPLKNLRWMESIADHSMVLDFPTGGISRGAMVSHIDRLSAEGHDIEAMNASNRLGLDYNACLLQTKLNNDEFVKHRASGATQFLNVLQGRSERESKFWYDAVKHYPFEGWAFAGHHQDRFSLILGRLIDMREDGLLAKARWIHVLGIATLPIGVLLTTVLRAVREHDNPDFQISFDTASPFLSGANKRLTSGATFDEQGWSLQYIAPTKIEPAENGRNLGDILAEKLEAQANSDTRNRRVARTMVSRHFTLGDMRQSDGNLSPDGDRLCVHHNVEAMIDAHDRAHEAMFDAPIIRDPLAVPLSIKTIATMIEQILASPVASARQMIGEWRHHLDALRTSV